MAQDAKELEQVAAFAQSHGLKVVESHQGRRCVVVNGTVAEINKAFDVTLYDYDSPRGKYRGHEGSAGLPDALADIVEAVSGLDDRQVPARHYAPRHRPAVSLDPPNTKPLTPLEVAQLYSFPAGRGAGQTIGIYEMQTQEGSAGYTAEDLALTMKAMDGGLKPHADRRRRRWSRQCWGIGWGDGAGHHGVQRDRPGCEDRRVFYGRDDPEHPAHAGTDDPPGQRRSGPDGYFDQLWLGAGR